MKIEDLDLFTEATKKVFEEVGFEISVSDTVKTGNNTEIVANIGITGDAKGFLILKSDIASASNFIKKMLANLGMHSEEEAGFGQFHKEAMGELLNQISGRSMMLLEKNGYCCDITPPTLIIGENIFSKPADARYVLNKSLTGSYGLFTLYVGIK